MTESKNGTETEDRGTQSAPVDPVVSGIPVAKTMWLFTNRNCLVFDKEGEQIVEYQRAITCYSLDKEMALRATREALEFHIGKWRSWEHGKWRSWEHEISRDEMQYLLGIKSREDAP